MLTTFILLAVNAYHAGRELPYSAASAESKLADTSAGSAVSGSGPDLTSRHFLHASDADLSIGASERQMLYQAQDAAVSPTVVPDADSGNSGTALQTDADNQESQKNQTQLQSGGADENEHADLTNAEITDTEKTDSKKTDTEKPNSTKTDTEKPNSTKTDKDKTDSKKTDTEKTDSKKTNTENTDTKNTNIDKTDIGKKDTEKTDIEKPDREKTDLKKTDTEKTDIKKTDINKTNANKADLNKTDTKKPDTEKKKKDQQSPNNSRRTFQTVTEDYFSDALFIGDSRTVGMFQSHLLPQAAYYAKTGIGIGDLLTERIVNEGGVMISVTDALQRHSFGKVYIMIGINDIARGDVEWFTEQYKKILATVRQTQPDAVIYIQGNIPMSYRTQDLDGALNNQNLSQRDKASQALADAEHIFYLDISSIYADANGHLASAYTRDGLHVCTDDYPLWVDYLLRHAIVCT